MTDDLRRTVEDLKAEVRRLTSRVTSVEAGHIPAAVLYLGPGNQRPVGDEDPGVATNPPRVVFRTSPSDADTSSQPFVGLDTEGAIVMTQAPNNEADTTPRIGVPQPSAVGAILASNRADVWEEIAGNTTSTKKFLTGTGDGTDAGTPGWNTIVVGDIPSGIDHGGLAGLTDDDHTQYLLADGTRGLSAAWDAGSWQIRAETFQSDVATGTAPLTVASTTVVTNLNADKLDGSDASAFAAATHATQHQNGGSDEIATATAGANAIPKAEAGGKLATGWIPNLPASIITSGQLPLDYGGTESDLGATGGTGQYLKQSSAGGAITVGTITAGDYLPLFTQYSTVTVNTTGSETSLLSGSVTGSLTIPANWWVVGRSLEFMCRGTLSRNTGSLSFKIKIGSTTLATVGAVPTGLTLSGVAAIFRATLHCRSTGGSGSIFCGADLRYDITSTGTKHDQVGHSVSAGSTIDTTATGAFDFTVTPSTSDAGLGFSAIIVTGIGMS